MLFFIIFSIANAIHSFYIMQLPDNTNLPDVVLDTAQTGFVCPDIHIMLASRGKVWPTYKPCRRNIDLIYLIIAVHCDSIITWSSGSPGKTASLYYTVIYMRPLFKIFNATSFTGFYIRKQMPHPTSFGMGHQSVYLILWLQHTNFHKTQYQ